VRSDWRLWEISRDFNYLNIYCTQYHLTENWVHYSHQWKWKEDWFSSHSLPKTLKIWNKLLQTLWWQWIRLWDSSLCGVTVCVNLASDLAPPHQEVLQLTRKCRLRTWVFWDVTLYCCWMCMSQHYNSWQWLPLTSEWSSQQRMLCLLDCASSW